MKRAVHDKSGQKFAKKIAKVTSKELSERKNSDHRTIILNENEIVRMERDEYTKEGSSRKTTITMNENPRERIVLLNPNAKEFNSSKSTNPPPEALRTLKQELTNIFADIESEMKDRLELEKAKFISKLDKLFDCDTIINEEHDKTNGNNDESVSEQVNDSDEQNNDKQNIDETSISDSNEDRILSERIQFLELRERAILEKEEQLRKREEELNKTSTIKKTLNDTNTKDGNWKESSRTAAEHTAANVTKNSSTINTNILRFQKLGQTLTRNTDYTLFRDKLLSEIRAQGCEYIIDEKVQKPEYVSDDETERRKAAVRNFIIIHLDEHFHRLVKNYDDPKILLKQLDKSADPVGTTTIYALHRQFGDMYYDPRKETAIEFLTRFGSLVDKIKRCSELTNSEEKRNLIFAVEDTCPTIVTKDAAKTMTIEEIKEFLLAEERSKTKIRRRREEKESALLTNNSVKRYPETKSKKTRPECLKCGTSDHPKETRCPFEGLWKCYNCNEFVNNHYSRNCPLKSATSAGRGMTVGTQNKRPAQRSVSFDTTIKRKALKRLPFKKAKKLSDIRTKKGKANLVFYVDDDTTNLPEDQQYVWLDLESEDERDYAAFVNDQPYEAAMSTKNREDQWK